MGRCWAWVLVGLSLALGAARAGGAEGNLDQVKLPGESKSTARRLAAADKLAADQQWSEAVDEYGHILEEAGDDLVRLDLEDPRHLVQARRLCHLRLSVLPAAALSLYRKRVDEQARKWLEQGEAERDARLLRRIVEESFCSRWGDRALDILGDLAFERGDFEEAQRWWGMLAPHRIDAARPADQASAKNSLELVFPDPHVDLARVRAKQVLTHLFQGDREGFQDGLKRFRASLPKAVGELAGRKGTYADTLEALARQGEGRSSSPAAVALAAWTTFAGDGSRNLVVPRPLGRLVSAGSQWPVRLDGRPPEGKPEMDADKEATPHPPLLKTYPLIVGDQVLVADAATVISYDLWTARVTGRFDLQDDLPQHDVDLDAGSHPSAPQTLTVADQRIYARLGASGLTEGSKGRPGRKKPRSILVCLGLHPNNRGKLVRYWPREKTLEGEADALFEGAPVVHGGRVHIAWTRFKGGRITTSIDCYNAYTGDRSWRQEVCEVLEIRDQQPQARHHLLTLAGSSVVYCSHSGAIVALDAVTGRRLWATRYPVTSLPESGPSTRDLAPCLFASGRLYAAPADTSQVLCLDAYSGQTLWTSPPVDVVHLLGVAHGRLIVTTGSRPRGIRALDAVTGQGLRDWIQPDDGHSELPSLGRGFLAGDHVYWPTREGLRVLSQAEGWPLVDPVEVRHLEAGNMAYANGCLVVAGAERLWVYVPEARLLEKRRKEASARPQSALAQYLLARAEADAGLEEQALASLARAERLAGTDDQYQGKSLRTLSMAERHDLFMKQAARHCKDPDEAAALLTQAAGSDFSPAQRLKAIAAQARLWTSAGQPARALTSWQSILEDVALRAGWMIAEDRALRPAGLLAAERIQELIRAHGSAIYAPMEQQARAMLEGSESGSHPLALLERLRWQYPHSSAVGPALFKLAALHEKAAHFGAAAHAYRLLLQLDRPGQDAAPALLGLARAYERQGCWAVARSTWQRLAREHGDRTLAALEPGVPVRDVVAQQLQKAELRQADAPTQPDFGTPLAQSWNVHLAAGEHYLSTDFASSPIGKGYLFFARGKALTCREAAIGKVHWEQTLRQAPAWLGQHADQVIVAGSTGVQGLSLDDGSLLWDFVPPEDLSPNAGLNAFHLTSTRLVFLQGEHHLFALDAGTGRLLWNHPAAGSAVHPMLPGGRFHNLFHAGEEWVVIQSTGGQQLIFESATGRLVHQTETGGKLWPQPPVPVDESRLGLVVDSPRVMLLDAATGKVIWTRERLPTPSVTTRPPQLFRAGDALFLLVDGWQLERLDPNTGRPLWQRASGTEPLDVGTTTFDPQALYFVSRNHLHAVALADGKRLWKPVPMGKGSGPWRAARTRSLLVAFPEDGRANLHLAPTCLLVPVLYPQEITWDEYSLVICDPKGGRLMQRLNFSGEGSQTAVFFWERGLAVVVGSQAWGLTAAPRE